MARFIGFNSYNAHPKSQENVGLSTLVRTHVKHQVIVPDPYQEPTIEFLLSLARDQRLSFGSGPV
jgi:hypothetical protein